MTKPVPPTLGMYLDSALDQPGMAEVVQRMVADVAALLERTADPVPRPQSLAFAVRRGRFGGGRYTDGVVNDLLGELRAGSLDQWSVTFTAGMTNSVATLDGHAVVPDPTAALHLSLTVYPPVWPPDRVDTVAEELLAQLLAWAVPLDLLAGAVTYDRLLPSPSPYERWYGLNHRKTAPRSRQYLRGYYWANLLTAEHLERIGTIHPPTGIEATAVPPTPSGGRATLIRATGAITAFDDQKLAAMKELLTPALFPAEQRRYEGYPLRILPE